MSKDKQLFDAASAGRDADVERLIKEGADVNWKNPNCVSLCVEGFGTVWRDSPAVAAVYVVGCGPNGAIACCCDVLMFVVHKVFLCVLLCACCVGPQCGGSVGSCPTSCQ